MRIASTAAAALVLAALAACGKDDGGTTGTGLTLQASCDLRPSSGQCSHYTLSGITAGSGVQNVQDGCSRNGGAFGATCPPAGAVGRCDLVSGATTVATWYYPSHWTAQTGAASCARVPGGAWTPL